ncbi:nitroreductase family protein [Solilutibacter silvestris]|uniref:Putative NAD(P)H nitroreductase n=1 Tax=Solilutibacter silvestris TaxID=1645665 RepID=A0A2K1PXM0_9GAMM|nr:nitroreductase [Lysobacter silvestris]PNS07534.1 Nitroreductase family protein [Lysobacter silvestris]
MTFQCLDHRRSVPSRQLSAPGPSEDQFGRILRAAVRVPDHGKRVPFRFLRITGDARLALGALLEARTRESDPGSSASMLQKERERFSFAPLIVTVIAKQGPDEKIPASERFSSASCVCFALLQAAQVAGFGAQWLTGWAAYDPVIRAHLGVGDDEAIVGFIHIGTPLMEAPERERPDPTALISDWTPR